MSCSTDGNIVLKSGELEIIKGSTFDFDLFVVDDDGYPYDITGVSVFNVLLPTDAVGGALTLSIGSGVTVASANAGHVQVSGTAIQSATLYEGNNQSFEARITISSDVFYIQFVKQLSIKASLFT